MKPSCILLATIGAGLALAQESAPPPPPPDRPPVQPSDRPEFPPGPDQRPPRPRFEEGQRPRFDQERPRVEGGERPRRPQEGPRFERNRPHPEDGRPPLDGPRPPRGEGRPESGRPPLDRDGNPMERPQGGRQGQPQDFAKRIPQKPQAYLGLVTRHAGPDLSAQLRQPEGFGLVVEEVLPDSPAKTAGLERNDLLIRYEDQLLANPAQLEALVRRTGKDKEASVTILRGGAEQKLTIKVGEKMLPERRPYRSGNAVPGNSEPRHMRGDPGEDFGGGDRQVFYAPKKARIERRDEQGRYELAPHEGIRTFVVLKPDGAIAWRGPVETAEQRAAVPVEWKPKLELLERAVNSEHMPREAHLPAGAL